jgi:hypothetical protein
VVELYPWIFMNSRKCDREASDGESEDDGRDAGSHPRKKRTFVGQVIAGAIRV